MTVKGGAPMNPKWTYGDAGDRWPVQFGDLWKVGPHHFVCGDIQQGYSPKVMALATTLFGREIDMIYSDPPWDAGNAKGFRTKAGYINDEKVDFEQFNREILYPFKGREIDIYIEGGVRTGDMLKALFSEYGFTVMEEFSIKYFKKHPCWLYHLHADPSKSIMHPTEVDVTGMDDTLTPFWAVKRSSNPGDLIYDCCMGQGLTSRAAATQGRLALGLELNPRRLAVTIDELVKLFPEYKPEKIGEVT